MKITLLPLVGLILVAAYADGQEYPRWKQLSSKTGDLPSRKVEAADGLPGARHR